MTTTFPAMLLPLLAILFVAHVFHPVDGLSVEPFLNGHVRHGCRARRAVPMLFSRGKPDHVTRSNLLDRASPSLRAAAACRDDQRLSERVRVPGGPRTGLECHAGADDARRIWCAEERIDAYRAGEVLGGSLCRMVENQFS